MLEARGNGTDSIEDYRRPKLHILARAPRFGASAVNCLILETGVAANTARNQRGRPFAKGKSGCPTGKPKGTRHKATLAAEMLLDGEAGQLTRRAIEMAMDGDTVALRLCLERIIPPRRERLVRFKLPELQSAADAARAMASITAAVAVGQITPGEAAELAKLVEVFVTALEANDFDQRLRVVEERSSAQRS